MAEPLQDQPFDALPEAAPSVALTPTEQAQAYWEQDDEAVGREYDALLAEPNVVAGEHLTRLVELNWKMALANRQRQKEQDFRLAALTEALETLVQSQEVKPARKRATRVPKAALVEVGEPDGM